MSFKCGGERERSCLLQPENSPQWRLMEYTDTHKYSSFSQGERACRQWGRSVHIFLCVVGVRRERVGVCCVCICVCLHAHSCARL